MSPEDQKILEIARDLCRQLGYNKLIPATINWTDRIGIRRMPPNFFLLRRRGDRGIIRLSRVAMGKLDPEEWRPILASGIAFYKNFGREYFRAMLTTMIPVILLLVPALLLTFRYLGGGSIQSTTTRYIVLSLLIALTIFQGARLITWQKKIWFKADNQAALLTGKEALLSSLRKMDSIDKRAGKDRRGTIHPSIAERSGRLEKMDKA